MLNIFMLIFLVYGIVEIGLMFGMGRKISQIIPIPLGLVASLLFIQGSTIELIIKGLMVGVGTVGTRQTFYNISDWLKFKMINR